MKNKKTAPLVFFANVIVTSAISCSFTATATELILEPRVISKDLVETVARIGQQRNLQAKSGTDILKLISQYCGSANARRFYLPIFIRANSDNEEIKTGKTILTQDSTLKMPACLYAGDDGYAKVSTNTNGPNWSQPIALNEKTLKEATTPENNGQNVPGMTRLDDQPDAKKLAGQKIDAARLAAGHALPEALAKRGPSLIKQVDSQRLEDPILERQYKKLTQQSLDSFTAASGDSVMADAFERSLRTQDILASNAVQDYTNLPLGAEVVLSTPSAPSGPVSFTLKTGVSDDEAVKELKAALPQTPLSKVSGVTSYFAEVGSDDSCPRDATKPWPFDLGELTKVLSLRRSIKKYPKSGSLLVFDTGFPEGQITTQPFKQNYFVRKTVDIPDFDQEPFLWSAVPRVYFHSGKGFAEHGVEVLSLALGGVDILTSDILETSIISPDDGYVLSYMGYKLDGGVIDVDEHAAVGALLGTISGQSNIQSVNLSLKFNTQTISGLSLRNSVRNNTEVLYVFAAGNDGEDVGKWHFEPAEWGGSSAENAITVGGINPDGTFHQKSNRSKKYVDIAAPGCGVPTYSWNAQNKKFEPVVATGTSIAAPLVSFVGNLLRGDLVFSRKIKSRILASGRFYTDLDSKVVSSRALDIASALAVQFDVIRYRDGRMGLGLVQWEPGEDHGVFGKKMDRDEIYQLAFTSPNGDVNIAQKTDVHGVDFIQCTLDHGELPEINFREAADGSATLGAVKGINREELASITFCDHCYIDNGN